MPTINRFNGKMSAALKKAVTILTTTGFFAAAVFLAANLWLPANAAPPITELDVRPSLLLALDKPERPGSKLHLRDLPSLTDEEMDTLASLPSPDLVAQLNSWTYTANPVGDIFLIAVAQYLYEYYVDPRNLAAAYYYKSFANLETLYLLEALGFHSSFLSTAISIFAPLTNALSIFAPPGGKLSPSI